MARDLRVELGGKTASFDAEMKKAKRAMRGVTKAAKDLGRKIDITVKETGKSGAAGQGQIADALDDFRVRYPEALGAALYEEASLIFVESQEEVPVDTGRLLNSGGVSPPIGKTNPRVEIFYGTDYALPVHERDTPHVIGKSKFLEDPFRRAVPGMLDRLAERTMDHVINGTGITPLAIRPPAPKPNKGRGAKARKAAKKRKR